MRANQPGTSLRAVAAIALLAGSLAGTGCCSKSACGGTPSAMPRELDKVSLSAYILEPPDIILVDAIRMVPKPPYKIAPLDELFVQVSNPLTEPISGIYPVDPDGTITLGAAYGAVNVNGLTLPEARTAIINQLKKVVKEPVVLVTLARSRAFQQVRGEHLIRPDGTVGLGVYGSVHVAGMTIDEARQAIENHLSQFVLNPEVSVDVFSYNSKYYYVVTDGAGAGEQVFRLVATGNETVLDALSLVQGLPPVASKKRIWLARPAPAESGTEQILPVDWNGIVRGARTATNYQVLPGDRIYVQAQPIITADTYLARIIAPIERIFGVTLLGNATVEALKPGQLAGGGF
jgi:polysaccharide export outer membrane protein